MTYPNHFAWRTEPPSGLYGAVLHGVMGDVALSAEVGVAVRASRINPCGGA